MSLRPEMSYACELIPRQSNELTARFHLCPSCGQQVDRRDQAAVYYHEGPAHDRLPPHEAVRLLLADERLAAHLQSA